MDIIEILKIILLGIVEGITEWLPVSSTGHLILLDQFINLKQSGAFKAVFTYVIQLGAILAVVVIFWKRIFPFSFKKGEPHVKKDIFNMWLKIIVACVPGAIAGILLNDIMDEYLSSPFVIAAMLIFYGILFIIIESRGRKPKIDTVKSITFQTALIIGLFQVLSIIPGTSRSGATIIGALLIGVSRVAAAEFTFYLAIPTMVGASLLKIVKFGLNFSSTELIVLLIGSVVAFLVSVFAVKFLMGYVKKHDFKAFGVYRIVLGIVVIIYFAATALPA